MVRRWLCFVVFVCVYVNVHIVLLACASRDSIGIGGHTGREREREKAKKMYPKRHAVRCDAHQPHVFVYVWCG